MGVIVLAKVVLAIRQQAFVIVNSILKVPIVNNSEDVTRWRSHAGEMESVIKTMVFADAICLGMASCVKLLTNVMKNMAAA